MTEVDQRYKRGMIYTIRNYTDDTLIYVGSTINTLSKRFNGHKRDCKKGYNISLYNYIENNDWTDWYIELFEAYSCNNKQELQRREGQVIREIGTCNKNIPGRTLKEWYEDNADKLKERQKEYYEQNIDKIKEQQKEYQQQNADKIKKYREENADKIKEYKKEYYEQNVDKIKEYQQQNADKIKEQKKEWRENNKEKISQHKTEKICCDICSALISRHNISKHQRTKTCLAIKNLSNTDKPSDSHIVDL